MADEVIQAANDMTAAGDELQAEVDAALPPVRGLFSQTAANALVSAANAALTAGGFDGNYPEFDADLTELPAEFLRLLMMLSDAAAQVAPDIVIDLSTIEDDRDLAMLASQLQQLASSAEFQQLMGGPGETEVVAEAVPAAPAAPPEEALMMERM